MGTYKIALALSTLLLASGCASIIKDSKQAMRVQTFAADGTEVTGARCLLESDDGNYYVRSPRRVMVERSSGDLLVTCEQKEKGLPRADGRIVSRATAAIWGNVIFGGPIGAAIDHGNGNAYSYPEWIQLKFGELRVFDGADRPEGRPSEPRFVSSLDGAGLPNLQDRNKWAGLQP